jgi:hypothetical protein
MKKITAFAAMAALACSTAFAAQNTTSSERAAATKAQQRAAASNKTTRVKGDSVGAKMKRGLSRVGDKIRNTGNRVARATGTDRPGPNTASTANNSSAENRAVSPARSDAQDVSRRDRMDEAYDNYRSKQR